MFLKNEILVVGEIGNWDVDDKKNSEMEMWFLVGWGFQKKINIKKIY